MRLISCPDPIESGHFGIQEGTKCPETGFKVSGIPKLAKIAGSCGILTGGVDRAGLNSRNSAGSGSP